MATNSFAQMKEDSKVLTSTLSNLTFGFSKSETSSTVNPTQTGKGKSFGFRPELTYGKVKKNGLLSYGLSLAWGFGTQSNTASGGFTTKNHLIGFAPVISYQKFYPLLERLYYSPFARLSVGYQYAKQNGTSSSSASIQKGIVGSFEFRPFSLVFSRNARTNFIFNLGSVAINYDRTKSYFIPMLYNGKTISTNLTLNASISGIGFGIQKLF